MTPLRFANPSPPSGWIEDLHLQAVVHTRHTAHGPRATKSTRQNHRSGRTHPASPARWFHAYTCSPRGPALLPPSLAMLVMNTANLTSAPGGQDHTTSRTRHAIRPRSKLRCD